MKTVALLCLCTPIAAFGFLVSHRRTQQVQLLEALLQLLGHIRYEIASFCTAQDELFERYSSRVLEDCGFLSSLRAAAKAGKTHALFETLNTFRDVLCLRAEEERVLCEYAAHLGEHDMESELSRVDAASERLRAFLEIAREEARGQKRAARTLGVTAALFLFLLFV